MKLFVLLPFPSVRLLLGCLSRVAWWGEGTESVAGGDRGHGGRERSREHGSGSAVSLGANECHLGGPAPGVSQQAFRLLEQLQHTVRPLLLLYAPYYFLCSSPSPPVKGKERS